MNDLQIAIEGAKKTVQAALIELDLALGERDMDAAINDLHIAVEKLEKTTQDAMKELDRVRAQRDKACDLLREMRDEFADHVQTCTDVTDAVDVFLEGRQA